MLPDSLLQPSINVRLIDETVNPPTVQEEVFPPKIFICNLIIFNIFHNNKNALFLWKIGWNNSPTFSAAFKEKNVSTEVFSIYVAST